MLYPQKKLLHQKGFGEVVVRSQSQTEQPVGIRVPGRQKQGRHIPLGAQLPEQCKAVPIRQVDVQNHQFRACLCKHAPGRRTTFCRGNGPVSRRAQMFAQKVQQFRGIIHQQQSGIVNGLHDFTSLSLYLIPARATTGVDQS